MTLLQTILLGIALAMDAFAASICQGLAMGRKRWRQGLIIAAFFGVFQGLMPLLGWMLGVQFATFVEAIDHWVAFGLLTYLGISMVRQSFSKEDTTAAHLALLPLLGMALATSMDAFAVGVSFAFLRVDILPAVTIIGVVTFCLSWIGVLAGHALGQSSRAKAQWTGGVILCLLGTSILLKHTILA